LDAPRVGKPEAVHGFMKYENATLIDELAARYALGTLRGPARRRMERICRQNVSARTAVLRWEERLANLADDAAPVQPPAVVWGNIREQLHQRSAGRESRHVPWRSRFRLAMAAGIAALSLAVAWWVVTTSPATQLVATITNEQQMDLWSIQAAAGRDEIRITASADLTLDTAHAYELWALSKSGGAPVSLGLMPLRGQRVLPLDAIQRSALVDAQQVAISREPPGGSLTGAPTGPVLFVAEVLISG
jgi:anti-sigma-K factor RskA